MFNLTYIWTANNAFLVHLCLVFISFLKFLFLNGQQITQFLIEFCLMSLVLSVSFSRL